MVSGQGVVLGGVAVYLVAMLIIGVVSARRANSVDQFLVAGRSLPLWLCAATLTATWIGSGTIIGAAGAAYEGGVLATIADPFGAALCLFLSGLFFVRTLRRMELITVTDFFEIRFGKVAGLLATVSLIVAYIGWTGAQLVAFGFILHTITGIGTTPGIFVAAAIVLSYTAAGGMWAVALTDFVQVAILMVGLVLILPVVLADLGGWSAIVAQLPEHSLRLIPVEKSAGAWLDYFRAWAILGVGSIATQDLLQRAFSARSERVAQHSFYVAGVAYLTIGMIPVALGLIGSVSLPGLDDPEFVVPVLAMEHLPPVGMAVFVGALLAAIMSSADSALLAPASLLSTNLVPYVIRDISERGRLVWARGSVPVFGIAALVVALWVQAVYDLMLSAFSVTLVALIVPFTAGVWWPRANRAGALAAMLGGTAVWIGAALVAPELPGDFLGAGAAAVLLLVVTPLTQRLDPPRPLRDRSGRELELGQRVGVG